MAPTTTEGAGGAGRKISVWYYRMKPPRLWLTIVSVMTAGTVLTSCHTGKSTKPTDRSAAAPGTFSTLIGIGPEGNPDSDPGWFEDPVDLKSVNGGKILVLTKEYGRVFSVDVNGQRRQKFSLPGQGEALSLAVESNGTITVAQKVSSGLAIVQAEKDGSPREVAKLSAATNPRSVHLVYSPDGQLLLLKDGQLLREVGTGKFAPLARFKGIAADTPVLAAATDGNSLLIALPKEIAWTQQDKVTRRVELDHPLYPEDGAAVVPDGTGGAYVTGRGSYVSHISAQGRDGSVLLGNPARVSSICGSGHISGPTGDAQQRPLGEATALSVTPRQLYVADPLCHRILAIGLPVKEYFTHGR